MRWFTTTSTAVGQRLAQRRIISRPRKNIGHFVGTSRELENFIPIRYINRIAGIDSFCSSARTVGDGYRSRIACLGFGGDPNFMYNNGINVIQRREFLGCGDGEEGSMLAKVHEERQILGYSPEQLFAVVAGVDLYEDFLPWCQRSEILRRHPDGSFDAELEIGFKFLVESYVSRVELKKPKYVKTTALDSGLFDHLINVWEFNPGPVPGSCDLHFVVDFKFKSPFYRQIANMFFKEVVSRLVSSFNDRCRLVYGPGVQGEKGSLSIAPYTIPIHFMKKLNNP